VLGHPASASGMRIAPAVATKLQSIGQRKNGKRGNEKESLLIIIQDAVGAEPEEICLKLGLKQLHRSYGELGRMCIPDSTGGSIKTSDAALIIGHRVQSRLLSAMA